MFIGQKSKGRKYQVIYATQKEKNKTKMCTVKPCETGKHSFSGKLAERLNDSMIYMNNDLGKCDI